MTNTLNFDYKNKTFQDVTLAVMNDVLASNSETASMKDLYNAASKYVNISEADFADYYNQANEQIANWKSNGLFNTDSHELNEDELDMVVGGSFFSKLGDAFCAVGSFFKENAATIGIVVAGLLIATGVGAGIGAGIGALSASGALLPWAVTAAAASGASFGAEIGVCVAAIPAAFALVHGFSTGSVF